MYTTREQKVVLDRRKFHKGIMAVTRELGVSYNHLILVLKGKRPSARLMSKIEKRHPELLEMYR